MPDNKMNNPQHEKNLGGKMGTEGQYEQQSPGRNPNDQQSAGQRGGDRATERKGRGGMDKEGGRGIGPQEGQNR
jgi:hypothetical protein